MIAFKTRRVVQCLWAVVVVVVGACCVWCFVGSCVWCLVGSVVCGAWWCSAWWAVVVVVVGGEGALCLHVALRNHDAGVCVRGRENLCVAVGGGGGGVCVCEFKGECVRVGVEERIGACPKE